MGDMKKKRKPGRADLIAVIEHLQSVFGTISAPS